MFGVFKKTPKTFMGGWRPENGEEVVCVECEFPELSDNYGRGGGYKVGKKFKFREIYGKINAETILWPIDGGSGIYARAVGQIL